MVKLESFGTISNGKLHIIHADKFKKNIINLPGGRYRLTLEKTYRKRSNPQNSYLFGVVYPIIIDGLKDSGFTDMDIDKVHDLCKYKFLKMEIKSTIYHETIETIGSTAKLSTVEFMEYLSSIQQWAGEYLNVKIPEPGQEMEIKFDN